MKKAFIAALIAILAIVVVVANKQDNRIPVANITIYAEPGPSGTVMLSDEIIYLDKFFEDESHVRYEMFKRVVLEHDIDQIMNVVEFIKDEQELYMLQFDPHHQIEIERDTI